MAFIVAALLCACLVISNADVLPLTVKGNQVLIGGAPGSLSGMSLFWSNNGWGAEKFYNKKVIEWFNKDWKATIIRAAMGIEGWGGYLQDPDSNKARVKAVVDAALELDMYVIIDWHDHYANQHQAEAVAFFEEMARTYGGKPNVIYELWNEPKNDVTWKDNVKPYAEAVIKAIRAIDTTNLILVGSPTWSQDADLAALNPISGYENIAYTLHFGAGFHGQNLRDKAASALNSNAALFVSEWGISVDDNGTRDLKEVNAWVEFMKANNLSNCNWSLNDKDEGPSALRPGVSASGGWSESDLTESGKFLREMIRNWSN